MLNNGMKHVARRHYYAKEMQADGEIAVTWVETKLNLADALTKALALPQFIALVARMRRLQVLGGRAVTQPCVRRCCERLRVERPTRRRRRQRGRCPWGSLRGRR